MSRGDIILRLVDVTRVYETKEGRKIVALNKVTTSFKRGEFVAVVGKSGSGKSTLINILGGLDTPTSGDYFLEGNNISHIHEEQWDAIRNEKIGFVFQEYHLIEYLSVYKNVEIALKFQKTTSRKARNAKIRDILERVGLLDHMHKLPGQLSGGQRQRVAIARALVKDPAIVLADEPTGALDHKTSETVIDLIKGLSKDRLVVVVTHDRGIASEHATRIIELSEGAFISDLVKEDIPQTYQNVYQKTKPTKLGFIDRLELTLRKLGSRWIRTFFTSLSLALAFAFTILFSGVERGISESYDAYYDALNKSNGYGFVLQPFDQVVSLEDYQSATSDLVVSFTSQFDNQDSEIITGVNPVVAFSQASGGVEKVFNVPSRPDPLSEFKLRLIDIANIDKYSYNDLFVGDSHYPIDFDEVMVTSRFYREYAMISDDVVSLAAEVGSAILIPEYTYSIQPGILQVEPYLDSLVELEDGSIVKDNPLFTIERVPVRYLKLTLPLYCYNYDDLTPYYRNVCQTIITDTKYSRYFDNVEELINYIDDFKSQVNQIDPDFFDLLFRSNAIYYMIDEKDAFLDPSEPRYIQRVYQAVYDAASTNNELVYFADSVFKEQLTWKEMTVTAIIENENESILYMDYQTYDHLFQTEPGVQTVEGYYSVNLESGITQENDPYTVAVLSFALPLDEFDRRGNYSENFTIKRNERIESIDECAVFTVDNYLNENTDFDPLRIVGDVFNVTDYSGCKLQSDTYHYLLALRVLFGLFFNTLMFISVLFFSLLLSVILSERISEIGVLRSVGSTSSDVRRLFYAEIIFEITLAALISIALIYQVNEWLNEFFLSTINQGSGVISFAGMKLSLGSDGKITNISFLNLAVYIAVVSGLLIFFSRHNVNRLANIKPIDILRSKEE
jgi:ABC-type lipoprotein export system ATPase subunit/ABC-type antimicrobial peptide transport system permease subunit